jgi:phycobilisome rod-core linker protein
VALPLLKYAPTTQNSRVAALRVGSDEDPKAVSMDKAIDREDQNFVIEAAYRQIFFHAFKVDRDRTLESQLRDGQITVRDFIRSLCLSDTFNRSFYNLNSNYKVARHLVEKLLGRKTHG